MKIAVTGASGNIGSALLRRLAMENALSATAPDRSEQHQVLGISRRAPHRNASSDETFQPEWLELDLEQSASVPELQAALQGYDAVVHLAWKLQPGHDQAQLARTNVGGTRNLLTAATRAGVGQIVVLSSVGAYSPGPKDAPVTESWPVDGVPSSPYSRFKAQVEDLLDEVERDHPQVIVTRLRPGLVFQSGAASEIARLFLGPLVPTRLIGRFRLPVVPLPRSLIFQVVHADDVAAAIWTVLTHGAGGAFNVAAGPVLTPDDLARAIAAIRTAPIPAWVLRTVVSLSWHARLQPTDPGWIDLATSCPVMSTEKLEQLGWSPVHTSVQALHELVTGLRDGLGDQAYPPLVGRKEDRASL